MRISIACLILPAFYSNTACAALDPPNYPATVSVFNLPHKTPTCGRAIALDGSVVGASGVAVNPGINFLYRKSRFIYPMPTVPAGAVSILGVNAHHVVVGSDLITNAKLMTSTSAFTYQAGATTMFSLPNASSVAATGITDSGIVIGYYQTAIGGVAYGFVKYGSQSTTLDADAGDTIPQAITAGGSIVVGLSLGSAGAITSWMYENGIYTPIAYPNATLTAVGGVYGPGWVTGTYFTGVTPNLVAHGFIYHASKYRPFNVIGATQTEIMGANALGQFTGCYIDRLGTHGFIASPK